MGVHPPRPSIAGQAAPLRLAGDEWVRVRAFR